MSEPDRFDTILRPVSPAEHPALPESGLVGAAELDVLDLDDLAEADTVVREPTVPASSVSDDEDDSDDDEEPHPPEALRFRVSVGGARFEFDEDLHIGRNPRPPRSDRGRPVRLLRVDSPTGVVSSSHLGLRRVGSTAVAADLMSTNGTLVLLPGFPPRRLRQGESLVAPPGTRLEIGEGIVIEVMRPGGLD